jgi:hypothetical protein
VSTGERGGRRAGQRTKGDLECSMQHVPCMYAHLLNLAEETKQSAMSSVLLPRVTHIYVSLVV